MDLDLPMNNRQHEAFAHARARGLTDKEAAAAAGYVGEGSARTVGRRADVRERIGLLLEHRARGGSRDVAGVIDKLMDLADQAAKAGEAKAWDVARHCLAEVARLKAGLPLDGDPAGTPPPRELTIQEWRARHDPTFRDGAPGP